MTKSQLNPLKTIQADHLNAKQQQAVLQTDGRILILAGAGSGKTSTITYRITHLVKNLHIDPETILGLTFTNKAAQEMKERVAKTTSKAISKKIFLSTFHSFCLKILREEIHRLGFTKNFSIYDEKDMRRLALQSAKDLLEHDGELPPIQEALKEIQKSRWSGHLTLSDSKDSNWHGEFTKDLYESLNRALRAYNALDFDSMLFMTVELIEKHPEVLEKYSHKYRYIMIDEYQDTNPIQYKLAKLLSSYHNNLCVVGDDDQSIYGWRGANIRNILEFEADHVIKLEQNYRSTKTILTAANAIIGNNEERHLKNLWSNKNEQIPIEVFHAPSAEEEAEAVVSRIISLKESLHLKWNDFAILYRSNALSRAFETKLMQAPWKKDGSWVRGVPYQVFGGLELLEKAEVKDALAYLKVIANPKDTCSLTRIINYPRRGISEKTLDLITKKQREKQNSLWELIESIAQDSPSMQELTESLSQKAYKGLCSFYHLIKKYQEVFKTNALASSFLDLMDTVGYKKAIQDEVKSQKMQQFKIENLMHIHSLLEAFEKQEDVEKSLEGFLANTMLDDKMTRKSKSMADNRVSLMTFHGSKGLEFPVCFLVGLEDHIIPHEKSLLETGLEEERRLMYVALTRCQERLFLSMARHREKHGKPIASAPSRFLFELPKELMKTVNWKFIETIQENSII